MNQTVCVTDLNRVAKMTKKEEIDAFLSKIIHGWTKTMLLRKQHACNDSVTEEGDRPHLLHGLSVENMYTEVTSSSKWVAAVVKKLTAILITITKGVKIIKVVAANAVPQVEVVPGTLEELDEVQGVQQAKMLVDQRKDMLFQQLEIWPRRVDQGKSSGCPCPVSWIPWHFLLGTWWVKLYQPNKTWNQSCWWWNYQRVVLKNSPTHGGWGLGTHEGDVRSGCYTPQPKPMV